MASGTGTDEKIDFGSRFSARTRGRQRETSENTKLHSNGTVGYDNRVSFRNTGVDAFRLKRVTVISKICSRDHTYARIEYRPET